MAGLADGLVALLLAPEARQHLVPIVAQPPLPIVLERDDWLDVIGVHLALGVNTFAQVAEM